MTTIVRTAVVPSRRWKNGTGRTRELLRWPAAGAADEWQVRISVAQIEADGPFSAYPGVDRWFAVLRGGAVELTIDGQVQRLTREDAPIAFDGAATTTCHLVDGPTADLNLMLRDVPGQMLPAADGVEWAPSAAQCGLYTALPGRCHHDGATTALPAHALLWFERAPAALRFDVDSPRPTPFAWWIEADVDAGEAAR